MNLAWLAAVVTPRDVALHPNFSSEPLTGPVALATVVQGDFDRLYQRMSDFQDDVRDSFNYQVVRAARSALTVDELEAGVETLSALIRSDAMDDDACATAVALLASVGYSELDDYDSAFALLDYCLERVRGNTAADARVLEAALLQQRALRGADLAGTGTSDAAEALALLKVLTPRDLSGFATSRSVKGGAARAKRNILDALRQSSQLFVTLAEVLPTASSWVELVRQEAPTASVRANQSALGALMAYVDEEFETQVRSRAQTWRNGDPVDEPIWSALLHYELCGNRQEARNYRRRLGELRLMRVLPEGQHWQHQDAIRLLRHAQDLKRLKLALAKVRDEGPLVALASDARQVINRRLTSERLREVELAVIAVGAQLLAPAEASVALDAMFEALAHRGPERLGGWELPSIRTERIWEAAVALAPVAERADEAASRLLQFVQESDTDPNELLDRALARAVDALDLSLLSEDSRAAWREWAATASNRDTWPSLAATVRPVTGGGDTVDGKRLELDGIAEALNGIITGRNQDLAPEVIDRSVELVTAVLSSTRQAAAQSIYHFGGISEAELAVGLAIYAGASNVWAPLTKFLLDPLVMRQDKSGALERLAREWRNVPADVSQVFATSIEALIESPQELPLDRPTSGPFPAATRLAAALDLLPTQRMFVEVSRLAGSGDVDSRAEAARTVALIASKGPQATPTWSVALAFQLSQDRSAYVRANAGRALGHISRFSDETRDLAVERLLSLLDEDGLIVPLLVLRGLSEETGSLAPVLARAVTAMSRSHMALGIRLQAQRVVSGDAVELL